MRWGRFGVPIAIIVVFFALGRISSVVVDWGWFSSIGYVGVFWTVFVTKAALFVVVFAVSAARADALDPFNAAIAAATAVEFWKNSRRSKKRMAKSSCGR